MPSTDYLVLAIGSDATKHAINPILTLRWQRVEQHRELRVAVGIVRRRKSQLRSKRPSEVPGCLRAERASCEPNRSVSRCLNSESWAVLLSR
jgi:hypothetical protein